MKMLFFYILFSIVIFAATGEASCKKGPFFTADRSGLMLEGYDVLTYYTRSRPIRGSSDFEIEYAGARWRFETKNNKDKFLRNPANFLPEFGGFCVWELSQGRLVGGAPGISKLVEGKLYFFSSEESRDRWMRQREYANRQAENNWIP